MYKVDTYRDGGTVAIFCNDVVIFSVDCRIGTNTKNRVYDGYPSESKLVTDKAKAEEFLNVAESVLLGILTLQQNEKDALHEAIQLLTRKMKMYCVFSKEALLKMNGVRGKLAAQAGHAYLHAFWDSTLRYPEHASMYQESIHAKKIALVVDTEKELYELMEYYKDICGVSLVEDAGFTIFKEPTITCLGIGPIAESNVGRYLASLPLLK